MPTISRFYGIVIRMYFDDHAPPHFHAMHDRRRATVSIEDLRVLGGDLDRRDVRLVLAWAEIHQEELLENWQRARRNVTIEPIEPLR